MKFQWCISKTLVVVALSLSFVGQALTEERYTSTRLQDHKSCGGSYTGYQYTITSPNYPANYPENQLCTYTLRGSELAKCSQEFHLQFLEFNLHPSEQCSEDYLRIENWNIYCGNAAGVRRFKSNKDNNLQLTFRSNERNSGKGFKILVTSLACSDKGFDTSDNETLVEVVTPSLSIGEVTDSNSIEQLDNSDDQTPDSNVIHGFHDHTNCQGDHNEPYPIFKPHIAFSEEDDVKPGRGDQPPQKVTLNSQSKVTSYLFLPPVESNGKFSRVTAYTTPPSDLQLPSFKSAEQFRPIGSAALKNSSGSSRLQYPSNEAGNHLPEALTTKSRTSSPFTAYGAPPCNGLLAPNCDNNAAPPPRTIGSQTIPATLNALNRVPFITNGVTNYNYASAFGGGGGSAYLPPFNSYNPSQVPSVIPLPNPVIPPVRPLPPPPPPFNNPGNALPSYPYPSGDCAPGVRPIEPNYPPFRPSVNFPPVDPNYPPPNVYPIGDRPFPGGVYGECCNTVYTTPRFLLTSPGFPTLTRAGSPQDCTYTIRRFSPDTCRLRFNLKFFNVGTYDQFCNNGFIEIDGRRFCGCRTSFTFHSEFVNQVTKHLRFRYSGYPSSKFTGFLIEVNQEPCGAYNPYHDYYPRRRKDIEHSQVRNSTDNHVRVRRHQREGSSNVTQSSTRDKRHSGYSYPKPINNLDVESVHGVHGAINSAVSHVSENLFFGGSCEVKLLFDWAIAAKEAYFKSARCPPYGGPPTIGGPIIPIPPLGVGWANCEAINSLQGTIASPLYPRNYPPNFRRCFRFYRAPNHCRIEMDILDFHLEPSVGCTKDYLVFSGQSRRYCGNFIGERLFFDLTRSNFLDMQFVTDSFGTGRGFNVGFTQIPC